MPHRRRFAATATAAAAAGFSLLELMLSLSLGLLLSGVMLQALMADSHTSMRLSRLLRERSVQRRSLDLVEADLQRATAVSLDPAEPSGLPAACSFSGRAPVLRLSTPEGEVVYAVGAAPSDIWRGQVLMRCGRAFGLDGSIDPSTTPQNRVVLDGLASQPQRWEGCSGLLGGGAAQLVDVAGSSSRAFSVCTDSLTGLLAVRVQQSFAAASGRSQTIQTERVLAGSLTGR